MTLHSKKCARNRNEANKPWILARQTLVFPRRWDAAPSRQRLNQAWGEHSLFLLPSIDWAIAERFNMINW